MGKRSPLPPGPRHLIGFKFIEEIKRNTLGCLANLKQTYGDIAHARMGPYHSYFLFHPDYIREVLVTRSRDYQKLDRQVRVLRQWNGNGLLLSDGEFWQRQHRLIQQAFTPKRLAHYAVVMRQKILELANRWNSFSVGQTIDVEASMNHLALEILSGTLFGTDVATKTAQISEAVQDLSEIAVKEMGQVFLWPRWLPLPVIKRKNRAIAVLDQSVRWIIQERLKNPAGRDDLLSSLLQAVDEDGDRQQMTIEQARDEAVVLLLAGHDTTATGLAWAIYALGRYPEVEAKLVIELAEVLKGRDPEFEDLPRLKYLNAFIKETLRYYPPAAGVFARQAIRDTELAGYPVRKNSIVYVFSYPIHHDERWFKDPGRFFPERFMENNAGIPQFAYFPFGGGPRMCIGMGFAVTEMAMALAVLTRRFRWKLASGCENPGLAFLMSLRPAGGLKVHVSPRNA